MSFRVTLAVLDATCLGKPAGGAVGGPKSVTPSRIAEKLDILDSETSASDAGAPNVLNGSADPNLGTFCG